MQVEKLILILKLMIEYGGTILANCFMGVPGVKQKSTGCISWWLGSLQLNYKKYFGIYFLKNYF